MKIVQTGSVSRCRFSIVGELIYLASSEKTLIPIQVVDFMREYIYNLEENINNELIHPTSFIGKLSKDISEHSFVQSLKDKILNHLGVHRADYELILVPNSAVEYLLGQLFNNALFVGYEGMFNSSQISGRFVNRYIVENTLSGVATETDFSELFEYIKMSNTAESPIPAENRANDSPFTEAPVLLYMGVANPDDGMRIDFSLLRYMKDQLGAKIVFDMSMGAFAGAIGFPLDFEVGILDLNRFFIGVPLSAVILRRENFERAISSFKENNQLHEQYKPSEYALEKGLQVNPMVFDSKFIYWLLDRLLDCVSEDKKIQASKAQNELGILSEIVGLVDILRLGLLELFREYEDVQVLGEGTPYVVLRFKNNPNEAHELFRFLRTQRVVSRYLDDRVIFDLSVYNTQTDIDDLLAIIEQYKSFTGVI